MSIQHTSTIFYERACTDLCLFFFFFFCQRGIYVAGLREEIVNSAEQVLKLIEMGEGLKH